MNTATLTLLAYLIILVPLMLLGYVFARRKQFMPHHKWTMTAVVILNWVLIGIVMVSSYLPIAAELPASLDQSYAVIATIHGVVGLIAQLMATYLVLLMWTENTRFSGIVIYRIKGIKTPMRITLSLWLITVLLGFGVYGVWYGNPLAADEAPLPATTEEAAPILDTTEEAQADPLSTEETAPEPAATEETAPEPAATEDTDATQDAAEDATDDAEDAAREATRAAEDATDDAEDAAEDATDAAEDAEDD